MKTNSKRVVIKPRPTFEWRCKSCRTEFVARRAHIAHRYTNCTLCGQLWEFDWSEVDATSA